MCGRSAGVSGSPLPPGPRHFGRVQRYRPSAVHRELAHAASSSLELSASFRVLQPTTCSPFPDDLATAQGQRAPPVGFQFPHRDISRRRPLLPGVPTPRADGPPSTFRTSSTVCSATCLAGLFRPAAASRVCPSGVCPSPRSRTGFRRPIHALRAFDGGACGLTRASDSISVFRALLPAESAVSTKPVKASLDPRPSWASPPPGFPSSHRRSAFTPPPPVTLNRNEPVAAGPRRIAGARLGLPGTRPPTRTRFLA
jgi:hypothetical protein